MFHHVVDTAGERIHIAGFHGREHADAKLVSAELTVSVGVHNAVFAQCRHHLGCIDAIVDIDVTTALERAFLSFTNGEA